MAQRRSCQVNYRAKIHTSVLFLCAYFNLVSVLTVVVEGRACVSLSHIFQSFLSDWTSRGPFQHRMTQGERTETRGCVLFPLLHGAWSMNKNKRAQPPHFWKHSCFYGSALNLITATMWLIITTLLFNVTLKYKRHHLWLAISELKCLFK